MNMTESSKDDGDIYEDLPDFHLDETISKLEETNSTLQKKLVELENVIVDLNKEIKSLNLEKSALESENKNLSTNISSLYKTAVAEVNRKDNIINELRKESYARLPGKNREVSSSVSLNNQQRLFNKDNNNRNFNNQQPLFNKDNGNRNFNYQQPSYNKDDGNRNFNNQLRLCNKDYGDRNFRNQHPSLNKDHGDGNGFNSHRSSNSRSRSKLILDRDGRNSPSSRKRRYSKERRRSRSRSGDRYSSQECKRKDLKRDDANCRSYSKEGSGSHPRTATVESNLPISTKEKDCSVNDVNSLISVPANENAPPVSNCQSTDSNRIPKEPCMNGSDPQATATANSSKPPLIKKYNSTFNKNLVIVDKSVPNTIYTKRLRKRILDQIAKENKCANAASSASENPPKANLDSATQPIRNSVTESGLQHSRLSTEFPADKTTVKQLDEVVSATADERPILVKKQALPTVNKSERINCSSTNNGMDSNLLHNASETKKSALEGMENNNFTKKTIESKDPVNGVVKHGSPTNVTVATDTSCNKVLGNPNVFNPRLNHCSLKGSKPVVGTNPPFNVAETKNSTREDTENSNFKEKIAVINYTTTNSRVDINLSSNGPETKESVHDDIKNGDFTKKSIESKDSINGVVKHGSFTNKIAASNVSCSKVLGESSVISPKPDSCSYSGNRPAVVTNANEILAICDHNSGASSLITINKDEAVVPFVKSESLTSKNTEQILTVSSKNVEQSLTRTESPPSINPLMLSSQISSSNSNSGSISASYGHCFEKFKKDGKTRVNPIYIGPRILTKKTKEDRKNVNLIRPVSSQLVNSTVQKNLNTPLNSCRSSPPVKMDDLKSGAVKVDEKIFSLFGKTPEKCAFVFSPKNSNLGLSSDTSLSNFSFLASTNDTPSSENQMLKAALKSSHSPDQKLCDKSVVESPSRVRDVGGVVPPCEISKLKNEEMTCEISKLREEEIASLFGEVSSDSSNDSIENVTGSVNIELPCPPITQSSVATIVKSSPEKSTLKMQPKAEIIQNFLSKTSTPDPIQSKISNQTISKLSEKTSPNISNSSAEKRFFDLSKLPDVCTPFKNTNDSTTNIMCTPAREILSPIPPTPQGILDISTPDSFLKNKRGHSTTEKSEGSELFQIIKPSDPTAVPIVVGLEASSHSFKVKTHTGMICTPDLRVSELDSSKKESKSSNSSDGLLMVSTNSSFMDKKIFLSPNSITAPSAYCTPFKTFSSDSLQSFMHTPSRELLSPIPQTPLGAWDIDNDKTNSCDVAIDPRRRHSPSPKEEIILKDNVLLRSELARNNAETCVVKEVAVDSSMPVCEEKHASELDLKSKEPTEKINNEKRRRRSPSPKEEIFLKDNALLGSELARNNAETCVVKEVAVDPSMSVCEEKHNVHELNNVVFEKDNTANVSPRHDLTSSRVISKNIPNPEGSVVSDSVPTSCSLTSINKSFENLEKPLCQETVGVSLGNSLSDAKSLDQSSPVTSAFCPVRSNICDNNVSISSVSEQMQFRRTCRKVRKVVVSSAARPSSSNKQKITPYNPGIITKKSPVTVLNRKECFVNTAAKRSFETPSDSRKLQENISNICTKTDKASSNPSTQHNSNLSGRIANQSPKKESKIPEVSTFCTETNNVSLNPSSQHSSNLSSNIANQSPKEESKIPEVNKSSVSCRQGASNNLGSKYQRAVLISTDLANNIVQNLRKNTKPKYRMKNESVEKVTKDSKRLRSSDSSECSSKRFKKDVDNRENPSRVETLSNRDSGSNSMKMDRNGGSVRHGNDGRIRSHQRHTEWSSRRPDRIHHLPPPRSFNPRRSRSVSRCRFDISRRSVSRNLGSDYMTRKVRSSHSKYEGHSRQNSTSKMPSHSSSSSKDNKVRERRETNARSLRKDSSESNSKIATQKSSQILKDSAGNGQLPERTAATQKTSQILKDSSENGQLRERSTTTQKTSQILKDSSENGQLHERTATTQKTSKILKDSSENGQLRERTASVNSSLSSVSTVSDFPAKGESRSSVEWKLISLSLPPLTNRYESVFRLMADKTLFDPRDPRFAPFLRRSDTSSVDENDGSRAASTPKVLKRGPRKVKLGDSSQVFSPIPLTKAESSVGRKPNVR